MFSKRIYLDYASITPIDHRVARVVGQHASSLCINPSSIHAEGVIAKKTLESSRLSVAKFLGGHADEIVFTASGTEANNLAIFGVIESYKKINKNEHAETILPHIIVSAIEHASVLETARAAVSRGLATLDIAPVTSDGVVDLVALKKLIRHETALISVMMVNNETGTIQPVSDIVKMARDERKKRSSIYPLVHTDACQAPLHLPIQLDKLGVDLLTLDGNKIYGPRGVGILYVRRGTPISPIIHGGGQELGLRSGTENIPAIAGFAAALGLVSPVESLRLQQLRNTFLGGLKSAGVSFNINGNNAVPHILNLSFSINDNEFFALQLDAAGIAVSTKSSCLHDTDESYVLAAMNKNSKNSIRFSFGRRTTPRQLRRTISVIKKLLQKHIDYTAT